MNILVCGGAGYIGAHMCKLLAEHGHTVTVFDNLSTGHAHAVRWGKLVQGDLLDTQQLEHAFAGARYDAVMHFSAKALVGESVQHPDIYYHNNVIGTAHLLDAMRRNEVPCLIFSSTAAVYGVPRYVPIDEDHPKAPINPYGRTKWMAEQLLADYDAAYSLRSVTLRYFNAAGADPDGTLGEDHEPETHLIPNVLRSLLDDTAPPPQVFGNDYDTHDGTCVRDYIHIVDLCMAHLKALEYLTRQGRTDVFNLGNGKGFSVLDIVRATERVTGLKVRYDMAPRRPGAPPVLVARADKARATLGWTPSYTDVEEIIQTAWAWHRKPPLQRG